MNTFQQTSVFAEWLKGLADQKGKARIVSRIDAAKAGNFGDSEPVGAGISEMRIDFGPGYRVYFMRDGSVIYLLLCGGDKSTQKADIALAKEIAAQVKKEKAEATAKKKVAKKRSAPSSKTTAAGSGKGKSRKG